MSEREYACVMMCNIDPMDTQLTLSEDNNPLNHRLVQYCTQLPNTLSTLSKKDLVNTISPSDFFATCMDGAYGILLRVLSPVEGFSTSRSGTDPGLEGCHQAGCAHLRPSLVGPIWPRWGIGVHIGRLGWPGIHSLNDVVLQKLMDNSG